MNTDTLFNMYKNNINSILNPQMLAIISDRSFDIHGLSLLNRLLVYIQNKYTESLKTEEKWDIIGRTVKSKSSPIWIIDDITKTEYMDAETNEIIEDLSLSPMELKQALDLGIIQKVKTAIGLRCIPMFNKKDTLIYDNVAYKINLAKSKDVVKISKLLEIAYNELNIECKKSNTSYYDSEEDILYIGNDNEEKKISAISDAISNQIDFNDILDSEIFNSIDKENIDIFKNISISFLKESVISLCLDCYNVEQSVYTEIEKVDFNNENNVNAFISMLSSVYELTEEVIHMINPNINGTDDIKLRKAAELLVLLEANEAYRGLKG